MVDTTIILIGTALTIGFLHTLFGPDHYLPFIVMSKARNWSMKKTTLITILCGIGHVTSSVVLGLVGIAFGVAVLNLEIIEGTRGDLAAWLLLGFGFAYFIWGVHKVLKTRRHAHKHFHMEGAEHSHTHTHTHSHSHTHLNKSKNITPWILFTIFVFGPCEPLIPILMYPAATNNILSLILVTLAFSFATIGTMTIMVLSMTYSLNRINLGSLEVYSHALAGAVIFMSGAAIKFLGL